MLFRIIQPNFFNQKSNEKLTTTIILSVFYVTIVLLFSSCNNNEPVAPTGNATIEFSQRLIEPDKQPIYGSEEIAKPNVEIKLAGEIQTRNRVTGEDFPTIDLEGSLKLPLGSGYESRVQIPEILTNYSDAFRIKNDNWKQYDVNSTESQRITLDATPYDLQVNLYSNENGIDKNQPVQYYNVYTSQWEDFFYNSDENYWYVVQERLTLDVRFAARYKDGGVGDLIEYDLNDLEIGYNHFYHVNQTTRENEGIGFDLLVPVGNKGSPTKSGHRLPKYL
ncbi:hypothetical protein [Flammeovirga aprica]|uniref:Uncharacterized protein n=1 Tax=Flammeovirga aprica JL-4 TaxID=694437 RepID=A0A7X9S190_9BACT|nr:hypothetical protein [Flammeovirga aprica]NME72540.1 hypothetical protein [Flammeovirga aprica JL-4]